MALKKQRDQIEQIDQQIAALFESRMEVVKEVALIKDKENINVLDQERERILIDKNLQLVKDELKPYYKTFFEGVLTSSRNYQREVLGNYKVAFQGLKGSYGYLTSKKVFENSEIISYHSFEDVFKAVQNEEVSYGVIPFENSHTGLIGETLDLFLDYDVYINDFYLLTINHSLLGVKGANLKDIKTVYSHPQAFMQCDIYLEGLQLEEIPYVNTATAAKMVSEKGDVNKGVIASKDTAALYGLDVLKEDIANNKKNYTRFAIISKRKPKIGDRMNIVFTTKHEVGALVSVLELFKEYDCNMESISSRSLKNTPWEYYFYAQIDFKPELIDALLNLLERQCKMVKVIGKYTK